MRRMCVVLAVSSLEDHTLNRLAAAHTPPLRQQMPACYTPMRVREQRVELSSPAHLDRFHGIFDLEEAALGTERVDATVVRRAAWMGGEGGDACAARVTSTLARRRQIGHASFEFEAAV